MKEESGIPPADKRSSLAAGIATRAGTVAFFIILQGVILFLAAGRLTWTWAWVYLGICLIGPRPNRRDIITCWSQRSCCTLLRWR